MILDQEKQSHCLNLIKEQDDIDNIYLYAKDLIKPKYEFLIKKCKDVGTNHFNDPNVFIECSNWMDDIDKNIDDYSPSWRRKTLIVFDNMIADIMSKKNFKSQSENYLLDAENWIFHLCLSHSLIFLFQKMSD